MRKLLATVFSLLIFLGAFAQKDFSGDYYVGANGTKPGGGDPDYTDLKLAFDDLSANDNTFSGDVMLYITSDITATNDGGIGLGLAADPGNYSITIKPAEGVQPTVTLMYPTDGNSGPSGAFVIGIPSTNNIAWDDAKDTRNITIDGSNTVGGTTRDLTIVKHETAHRNSMIVIFGPSENITFKNCNILHKAQDASSFSSLFTSALMLRSSTASQTGTEKAPSNVLIENNYISYNFDGNSTSGQAIGFYRSSGGADAVWTSGVTIRNNKLEAKKRVIALARTSSVDVYNNEIILNQDIADNYGEAVLFYQADANGVYNIYNNKISVAGINEVGGQGLAAIDVSAPGQYNIYNNMIADFQLNGTAATSSTYVRGIAVYNDDANLKIYNNSILMNDLDKGADVDITGLWLKATVDIKNNIVMAEDDEAVAICVDYTANDNSDATFESDYNDFFAAGATSVVGKWEGAVQTTLADWQTATSNDANSLSTDPGFVSGKDLHISMKKRTLIGNAGTPLTMVTTDIDGDARDATNPDLGADEGDFYGAAPDEVNIIPVWELSDNNKNLPDWWDANYKNRGVAIGNGHIYVLISTTLAYDSQIRVLDAETGDDIENDGKFLSKTGITQSGYNDIYDVAVDDKGVIVAGSKTHNKWHPFKVYKWNTIDSDPELLMQFDNNPENYRIADKISVIGSVNGNGVLYTAISGSNKVLFWTITDGEVASEPQTIELDDINNLGSVAGVTTYKDLLLVNGYSVNPTFVDTDGKTVYETDFGIGNSVIKTVQFQDKIFAATLSWAGSTKIFDLSENEGVGFEYSSTASLGTIANVEGSGDVDFTTEGGILRMAVLGTNNGLAIYQFNKVAPTAAVVDDENNTIGWTPVTGFDNADNYEYSVDNGATWTACTANPQPIDDEAHTIGHVQVRLNKASSIHNLKGAILKSDKPYFKSTPANALVQRGWEKSAAAGNNYSWLAGHNERAFGVGEKYIYVPKDAGNVLVINASTGEEVKYLSTKGTEKFGYYKFNDIEVSDDGQILVANLTLGINNSGWAQGPFVLYKWEDENSDPVEFLKYEDTNIDNARLGDKIAMVGDLSGDAAIYAIASGGNRVFRWFVTGGVINPVPSIVTLDGVANLGTNPVAAPLGTDENADFWVNGNSVTPMLYGADGVKKSQIDGSIVGSGSNAMDAFSYNGKDYLAVFQYPSSDAVIVDVTNAVTSDSYRQHIHSLGAVSNTNGAGDIEVVNAADGSLKVYLEVTNNGITAWATGAAPIATEVEIAGIPQEGNVLTTSYTYGDINQDAEGATTYSWLAADAVDGAYADVAGANSATLSLTTDLVGKFLKFEVTPTAATGTPATGFVAVSMPTMEVVAANEVYPSVANVAISGSPHVFTTVTGTYDYSDTDGDLEAGSVYQWYRADDASATNIVAISGETSIDYTITGDDDGKYLFFKVTPKTNTGTLLVGDAVMSSAIGPVYVPPLPPEAKNVVINGYTEIGRTLTGEYEYYDINGDEEGSSMYKWYIADVDDAVSTDLNEISNAVDVTLNVTSDMQDKYVYFEVTVQTTGAAPSVGGAVMSDAVGPVLAYVAVEPEITGVTLSEASTLEQGVVVTGIYTFEDFNNETEGQSTYKWYVADAMDAASSDFELINGATSVSYAPTKAEIGKYLVFEVTPVENSQVGLVGEPKYTIGTQKVVASTQNMPLERVWVRQAAFDNMADWFSTSHYERGMAYGNGKMYVASRNGGPMPRVFDAATGAELPMLSNKVDGGDAIAGGTFHLSDMAVSDDGQVLGCNLAIGSVPPPTFKVYKWASDDADPTVYIEYQLPEGGRIGDEFTMIGDLSGDALIFAVNKDTKKAYRWTVTGGTLNTTPDEIALNIPGSPSLITVIPISTDPNANIWVNGAGVQPTLCDKDGEPIGNIPGGVVTSGTSAGEYVEFDGKKYIAMFEYGTSEVIVVDVTSANTSEAKVVAKTSPYGENGNGNGSGDAAVDVINNELYVYGLITNNGVGAFKMLNTKPVAENAVIAGTPEVGVVLDAVYDYSDDGRGVEGDSQYQWYTADDANGTNKTAIDGAVKSTYLLTENEIGKFVSVEITPVAEGNLVAGDISESYTASAVVESTEDLLTLDRVWARSATWENKPEWFGDLTERGFAVGDEYVYVVNRANNTVKVLDAIDGSEVKELDVTGISGGTYTMLDAEYSTDGSVLVANLAIGENAVFKVYRWETIDSEPTEFVSFDHAGTDRRFGDSFTVKGDVTGDAVVMAIDQKTAEVIRWIVTGGVVGEPEVISLDAFDSFSINPSVTPLGLTANDGFIVNAWGIVPTEFDKDGNKVGDLAEVAPATTNLKVNYVEFGGKDWLLVAQEGSVGEFPTVRKAYVIDVTNGVNSDAIIFGETEDLGLNSNASHNADVDYLIDGDNFYVYVLQPNNGLAAYKVIMGVPPVAESAVNNPDGDEVTITFDRAMADAAGTESEFTVTANGTAITISSVATDANDNTKVVLTLGGTIAAGDEVKVSYTPGTVTSLEGTALEAFTDLDVLNLVGGEAPVASNVTISGTIAQGETLTGEYDYSDANSDEEGTSTYQWWVADDASGTNALKRLGENATTYVVRAEDEGKFIAFEVTPVAATGGEDFLVGTAVKSAWTQVPVGITEEAGVNFRAYPNPVMNELHLDNIEDVTKIEVMSLTGQVVRMRTLLNVVNTTIDMNGLDAGIYMVRMTAKNGEIATLKVVKQ